MAAPAIGVRERWAPTKDATVDWNHPLAVGLVACGTGPYDYVRSRRPSASAAVGRDSTGTPVGAGVIAAAAASDGGYAFTVPNLGARWSLVAWINGVSSTGIAIGWTNNAGTAGTGLGIGTTDADTVGTTLIGLDSPATWRDTAATVTGWSQVCVTKIASGACLYYIQALQVASLTSAPTVTGCTSIMVGGESTTTRGLTTYSGPWLAYNRTLTHSDVATLFADPFCMLRS